MELPRSIVRPSDIASSPRKIPRGQFCFLSDPRSPREAKSQSITLGKSPTALGRCRVQCRTNRRGKSLGDNASAPAEQRLVATGEFPRRSGTHPWLRVERFTPAGVKESSPVPVDSDPTFASRCSACGTLVPSSRWDETRLVDPKSANLPRRGDITWPRA